MEDQERIEEQEEEVEGHGRGRKSRLENEEPTDELAESDDVEAHRARKQRF